MKHVLLAMSLLGLCGCESYRSAQRPTPADTLPSGVPAEVTRAYLKATGELDDLGMPFAFLGSLKAIADKPHMNVHGEEWSMEVAIERLYIGSYSHPDVAFGISSPTNAPLEFGKKYYISASWGRHGMRMHEAILAF